MRDSCICDGYCDIRINSGVRSIVSALLLVQVLAVLCLAVGKVEIYRLAIYAIARLEVATRLVLTGTTMLLGLTVTVRKPPIRVATPFNHDAIMSRENVENSDGAFLRGLNAEQILLLLNGLPVLWPSSASPSEHFHPWDVYWCRISH